MTKSALSWEDAATGFVSLLREYPAPACIVCLEQFGPSPLKCPKCRSVLLEPADAAPRLEGWIAGSEESNNQAGIDRDLNPELAGYTDPDSEGPDDDACVRCGAMLEPENQECPSCTAGELDSPEATFGMPLAPDRKQELWYLAVTSFLSGKGDQSARFCPTCLTPFAQFESPFRFDPQMATKRRSAQ